MGARTGTHQCRGDPGLGDAPGEGELRERHAELRGDPAQLLDRPQIALSCSRLEVGRVAVGHPEVVHPVLTAAPVVEAGVRAYRPGEQAVAERPVAEDPDLP